ncbi:GNAT family N-acetyltransferase [Pokkaliibacter plantistimulans]|uniref:GNAT family N-acetyltransferase n=1 Tax=Proteobacteria bacterium 228 TaxID=2083153 RepID=A0A2S5KGY2_9PROT|nr:GNAT family N-acetyltransferase [Pokkaliibacter plantistimulans]PPC74038.1 GNAT family N-acetyltransferase [Pokkaliibacter plantistimulans]
MDQAIYHFRAMTPEDLPAAHGLSQKLKWPHRLQDWATNFALSKGVVVEAEGQVIGTALACSQGDYAAIGLVIVSDDYQGKGLGRQLMGLAMAEAGDRTLCLVATIAGAPLYAKLGFVNYGYIRQHQGVVSSATLSVPAALPVAESLRVLDDADAPALQTLLNHGSGMERSGVLQAFLAITERGIGIERDGQLVGFALLRPFGRGKAIGPVVAENAAQARTMIHALLQGEDGSFVRMDTPEQLGLCETLVDWGLLEVDRVAQMVKGDAPRSRDGFIQFALANQALG